MSGSELPPDRSSIGTELPHPESAGLDQMPTGELVAFLANDHARAVDAVAAAAKSITHLVEVIVESLARGGRLIYIGAGTSGRLGVLDSSECPPTFNSDPRQVMGIIAGGDDALRRSSEGMEDDPVGLDVEWHTHELGADDVVVGIAAGGTTPWVLGGLALAQRRGAATALVCCTPRDCPSECDQLVVLDTGPEALTGSTRLVAGTATKIALNTITTSVFTRLGKVRGNRMVDLRATNEKLHDRCLRVLCDLFPDLDREHAAKELAAAGGSVRTVVERRETKA